jgi:hypothetical protein
MKLSEALATGIVDVVKKTIAVRDEQIAALRARVSELEAKQAAREQQPARRIYKQHSIVTDDRGRSWLAERDSIAEPGSNSDWRVVVGDGGTQ